MSNAKGYYITDVRSVHADIAFQKLTWWMKLLISLRLIEKRAVLYNYLITMEVRTNALYALDTIKIGSEISSWRILVVKKIGMHESLLTIRNMKPRIGSIDATKWPGERVVLLSQGFQEGSRASKLPGKLN